MMYYSIINFSKIRTNFHITGSRDHFGGEHYSFISAQKASRAFLQHKPIPSPRRPNKATSVKYESKFLYKKGANVGKNIIFSLSKSVKVSVL